MQKRERSLDGRTCVHSLHLPLHSKATANPQAPSSLIHKGFMEHRMGFEPMNTGFADQRVSHFAIGARRCRSQGGRGNRNSKCYCG
jgi:hypothetical protein